MRGARAKALRRVSLRQAARVLVRHQQEGTCPNCGREVATFCSLIVPDRPGVHFGCPHCSELMARAVAGAKLARAARHMQN